jgi:hypothetical protein
MKRSFFLFLAVICFTYITNAQTLYVPAGTGGIGTSTNGNVGIGTTSTPTYGFESALSSAALGARTLIIGGSNEIWTQNQVNNTADLYINYRGYADGQTQFRNTRIYNGKGGIITYFDGVNSRVGIGTVTPVKSLHIRSDVANGVGAGILLQNEQYSNNLNAETEIVFSHLFQSNAPFRYSKIHTIGVDAYGDMRLALGLTDNVNDTYRDRLTILQNGNIGIGTVNPTLAKLQIKSTYGTTTDVLAFFTEDGTYNPRVTLSHVSSSSSHYLQFNSSYNSSCGYADFIFMNGRVGIGTTTPGNYQLNVSGKIRANEVVVNTTGADFVFDLDYKLPGLSDVDSFIKKNKHLPGIASAVEMKENGMNVSEAQTRLLQKVEELTLYIIELDKKNQQQSKDIEILKMKIALMGNHK